MDSRATSTYSAGFLPWSLAPCGDLAAEFDDGAAAALDRGGFAVEDRGDGFLAERAALLLERVR